MGKQREFYDEQAAAGRLGAPLAAWRWAAGSGLIPPADAGPGLWSRSLVDTVDAEGVRAALRGPMGAGLAADRLTEALGVPLPRRRPRVTATAVGHLVKAGLLVRLGGDTERPDVHPDQVDVLARRRDLPTLLDHHVPLGPDQAAARLGTRRADFDQVVRLGWVTPVGSVTIDYKSHGGWTTVPLYSAVDIALLPVLRPDADWEALHTVAAGRRSPLAGLDPVAEGQDLVLLAEVARIVGVGRAAVVNWRRRHSDFPDPVRGTDTHPRFERTAVAAWLLAHDKIAIPWEVPPAALVLRGADGGATRFRLDGPLLVLSDDAEGEDRLSGWSTDADADALAELAAGGFGASVRRLTVLGTNPVAVPGEVRVIDRFRPGAGGLRVTLAWPAGLRGAAADGSAGGVVRHGLAYAGPEETCACTRHACGGVVPVYWCQEHGGSAEPVMEWHPGGGIRCTHLAGRRSSKAAEPTPAAHRAGPSGRKPE
ncbi:helix-turn-helix transcriptional regulator [Streptomyces antarcticus]|uniref:helix-turn-helix transcriptional regulator n=1 Tax=Streptomyces antarcticus TaxID=2996458 RepID=UPI002270920D|nr:hypothetical protein [Streptomyces sp. H34-AA3]MCY0945686.1 hypothetical protein [Streptomyces sp. H34-AA3]